ncbi:DUF1648 domain-containing protein [Streptomyces sp. NRRL WC-3742]|uniref:DUF1648 domain-containing protein n=1 Tax=Streptomyces sp. NRRL WC-3742 TaxID=1463934 RepID=UPI000A9B93AB|nr:DUF1648 domain-containing protein [Streptomyces sp. NRRL WC-3742]
MNVAKDPKDPIDPKDPKDPKDEEPASRRPVSRGALWGAVAWTLGVMALLLAMPLAARDRLPEQVATHWSGSDPDGSMSVTAAALFPAGIWLLVTLFVAAAFRFRLGQARAVFAAVLACTGVLLTGAQASIVHANLDRARWQDAEPMGLQVVLIILASGTAGALAWLATRRTAAAPAGPTPPTALVPGAPVLRLPAGERAVWLSHAANVPLQVAATVLGLGALALLLTSATGLTDGPWPAVVCLALLAVTLMLGASAQVRVTAQGLHVGFGPFGLPARHWALADLESARVEVRTARQAGGWGYRINDRGTTVMLRRGECLVVRTRRGADFAVSVDDAERGAGLLNSLLATAADAKR